MPDRIDEITEQQTVDGSGQRITTRAVSSTNSNATVDKLIQIVWFVASILLILLAIRFVFSLLGANQGNGFVDFIYSASGSFVTPFQGLFNVTLERGVSRFEVETLVAIAAYALLTWIITKAISLGKKTV